MRYIAGQHFGLVFCNGEELKDVIEVDTDLGFAVVTARDDEGRIIIEGPEIKTRLVLGSMTFVPMVGTA